MRPWVFQVMGNEQELVSWIERKALPRVNRIAFKGGGEQSSNVKSGGDYGKEEVAEEIAVHK